MVEGSTVAAVLVVHPGPVRHVAFKALADEQAFGLFVGLAGYRAVNGTETPRDGRDLQRKTMLSHFYVYESLGEICFMQYGSLRCNKTFFGQSSYCTVKRFEIT